MYNSIIFQNILSCGRNTRKRWVRISLKTSMFDVEKQIHVANEVLLCLQEEFEGMGTVALPWCVSPCMASGLSTNPGTQQFTNRSQLS